MAAAPSTLPENPLDASLKKLMGSGEPPPIGYDPSLSLRPTGDILNIAQSPGTGVSTPEQWQHEVELERQKQSALEFEFEQRMKAEDQARAAAQLAMDQAEEKRRAALSPSALSAAELSNAQTKQAMEQTRQTMGLNAQEAARQQAQTAEQIASSRQAREIEAYKAGLKQRKPSQEALQRAYNPPALYPIAQTNAQQMMSRGAPASYAYSNAWAPTKGTAYMGGYTPEQKQRMQFDQYIRGASYAQAGYDPQMVAYGQAQAMTPRPSGHEGLPAPGSTAYNLNRNFYMTRYGY